MTSLTRGVSGWLIAAAVLFALAAPGASFAETCRKEDFAKAVDEAGESLRAYNAEAAPQLTDKLRQLKTKKGWKDDDYERVALDYLHDARIAGLDQKANDLLAKVDELGTTDDVTNLDCNRLSELKASSLELLAVMKAKSKYLIGKVDAELNPAAAKAKPLPPVVAGDDAASRMIVPPGDARGDARADAPASPSPPSRTEERVAAVAPQPRNDAISERWGAPTTAPARPSAPAAPEQPSWSTTTESDRPPPDEYKEPPAGRGRSAVPDTAFLSREPGRGGPGYDEPRGAEPGEELPPLGYSERGFDAPNETYSIEEIREATRGFFGNLSTSLAEVIEHAFRQWGKPTAYVLGSEGGGALLAGLRYGKGTLYMRRGNTQTVHWHGPSLGYDFGADSSRTMFLIYSMTEPEQLFRRFGGVDGTAYLVGGAGVTLLKGGPIIMAPVRTGIGLRVGASVGYVRFTPEATWNPF